MIRAKDETVWMRMKEKGNKAAGRTGPDDGIGGEWSKINVRTTISMDLIMMGTAPIDVDSLRAV